ncbi:phosphotransferase [Streptomyces sp. KM273126]|uniref:aminoglycoside phosphotransferase family protein n=1 Tax=Streptomyces sp. KM273126 TaxID=2545247 RepID=UPI00103D21D3|nr:aminoglycoside phosphotransferase family protein [Streptomyces sp. KM273126]MBA2812476.1 phosphotransferase [Streptomyces sp. KM273126]
MTSSAPPAVGVRTSWEALPAAVRAVIADMLGAPVVQAVTQTGGFSPGVAARVTTAGGRRAFVKAVSAEVNPVSPEMHREEARYAAALPLGVPAPPLLGSYDDGTWVALVFEDVAGRQPHVPWHERELALVLDAVGELSRALTPAPLDAPSVVEYLADGFQGWQQMIDDGDRGEGLDPWTASHLSYLAELALPWTDLAVGDTLAHGDLRADNILLTADGRVVFVDWPHARRGAAPWFDLLIMLPCVRAQGGPDPEEVFTAHPLGRVAEPDAVTATLAGFAGFMIRNSRQPPPPGIPTLRAFQRAQGEAALQWLRKRLG